MRVPRAAVAAAAALLVAAAGCTTQVTGTPTRDPAHPPLALSEDGSGIVAGYPDAPVQIEIYTEPQCNHCAALQAQYGADLGRYINLGELAVTYRPLTFLDQRFRNDYSVRVANALFLAVESPNGAAESGKTSGPEFQRFVEELWADQQPGGSGPSDKDMAKMAKDAGIPEDLATKIGDGEKATDVNIDEMAAYNYGALIGIDPITTGTPTVYDLSTKEKVDIHNRAWLDNLMSSSS